VATAHLYDIPLNDSFAPALMNFDSAMN